MTSDSMKLVERFIDGTADVDELRRLSGLVRSSADFAAELRDSFELDRLLRIAVCEENEWGTMQERLQAILAAQPDRLEQQIAAQIGKLPVPQRPLARRGWVRVAVLAAAIVLGFATWRYLDGMAPSNPEIATGEQGATGLVERRMAPVQAKGASSAEPQGMFAAVLESSWAGDPPHPQPGFAVADRTYQLETGLVEVQVASAKIVLEGPAKFRLTDADRLEMQWGRATVSVDAGDFIVSTPSVDVVDLGTVFSVETSPGGDTEVHVLVGEVAAVPSGQGRNLSGAVHLTAGGAGVFREWQALDHEPQMPNEPIRFATAVQPCVGILQLRGLVRVVDELPSMDRTWTNRNDVLIRLEKAEFALPRKVPVSKRSPGRFVGGKKTRVQAVARGALVNSYLLQLGPGDWVAERRAEAVIAFDHEIIGIIADDKGIDDSDALFTESPLNLRERGLTETDEVYISEDGRSLYLDVRTEGVKQLRVLTGSR